MSLPKLEVPTYEVTLPSTNKKVKYRPFLVKEHKTLLMMRDSSPEEISRVMEEIVDICTFKKLKTSTLPSFDIEFLFTRIRAKSIGEGLDLVINCRECDNKVTFRVNLEKVQIQNQEGHEVKFMLTDNVGIEMKYPRFNLSLPELIERGIEHYFGEIEKCIKAIYTTDGKYFEITVDDKEELSEFVATMTSEQFEKVEQFFQTMPKLSHEEQVQCSKCGTMNRARVEGLANFFV